MPAHAITAMPAHAIKHRSDVLHIHTYVYKHKHTYMRTYITLQHLRGPPALPMCRKNIIVGETIDKETGKAIQKQTHVMKVVSQRWKRTTSEIRKKYQEMANAENMVQGRAQANTQTQMQVTADKAKIEDNVDAPAAPASTSYHQQLGRLEQYAHGAMHRSSSSWVRLSSSFSVLAPWLRKRAKKKVVNAVRRIRSHLQEQKRRQQCKIRQPTQVAPREPSRFIKSIRLEPSHCILRRAVALLRAAAKILPQTRTPIVMRNKIKHSTRKKRWGVMCGHGYGGPRVGKGFFRPPVDLLPLARAMCDMVPPENLDQMFGTGFAARYSTDNFLTEVGGAACFITVNFSHAGTLDAAVDELVHRDRGDQSSTLLLLWQHQKTPEQHRAVWYEEGLNTAHSISGGYVRIFNGRQHEHGLLPPAQYSGQWPWFGAALLVRRMPPVRKQ